MKTMSSSILHYNIMCTNQKEVAKCLNILKKLDYNIRYNKGLENATIVKYEEGNTFGNNLIASFCPGTKNISYPEFLEKVLNILIKKNKELI